MILQWEGKKNAALKISAAFRIKRIDVNIIPLPNE